MSVRIEVFEGLEEQLRELTDAHESVDGSHEIPMDELFPPDFMRTYTGFDSLEDFFDKSSWTVETREDFEQIPEKDFDEYVHRHTGFSEWDSMLTAAGREWITRQIT